MALEVINSLIKNRVGRRRAIQLGAVAGVGTLGMLLTGQCETTEQRIARETASMQQLIRDGSNMRTRQDLEDVFMTKAGIDLPFSRSQTVQRIRAISDPTKRVMAAIGYLDVENLGNRRYDVDEGSCNIYALDLLRLVLGNNIIGSRFNRADGSPAVFGVRDTDWSDPENISELGEMYPYLGAFNLDQWMRVYGNRYGWQKVQSSSQLRQLLRNDQHIALGVTKDELVRSRQIGDGHAFVLTKGADPGFGLTQATNNIQYKWIAPDDVRATPGQIYNIHAHRLTDF